MIDQLLAKYDQVFREKIEASLKARSQKSEIIYEAMKYSLLAGGKRIRPILMLETYKMLGGKEDILDFALAIEMIHTYSLIHDDLPVMDDDDFRRGKPTNHKVYGEAMALLAGDGLLNYAYEMMCESAVKSNDLKKVRAMSIIASSAGIKGMVGGQVVDMLSEGKKIDDDTLNFIYENKTSKLIQAPFIAGAVLAGACDETISILEKIGYNVGMAFQIQDDILDIESTTEVLGKPIKSDEKNEKSTYVAIHGIKDSKEKVKMLSLEAYDLVDKFDNNEILKTIINFLMSRSY